jgi:cytochrome d ubiquinol oxidase subunit II
MLGALGSLGRGRYGAARALAVIEVAMVLLGWARAQSPWLVIPDVTIESAAANRATQRAVLWAVAAGLPILGPSLWLLFRIFKSRRALGAPRP